jgi:hypothetical protein
MENIKVLLILGFCFAVLIYGLAFEALKVMALWKWVFE